MSLNPYAPIRKVPLDFEGISSSAYAVQQERWKDGTAHWKEVGVVGHKYMLLPNDEVRDAAEQVAQASSIDFTLDKTFFNGKNFALSYKSEHTIGEVLPGDDVAVGMQFWNSYDGTKAFGFAIMLYRLICTNGMMSKQALSSYRFKHEPKSEDWEESLEKVTNIVDNIGRGAYTSTDDLMQSFRKLHSTDINVDMLGILRHRYLENLPVSLWGNIIDRFTDGAEYQDHTGWNLLNAATDILWHKDKPTVASYDQNALIVDGLVEAVA